VTKDPASGLTLVSPQRQREYPITNIKLLSDAKAAYEAQLQAEAVANAVAVQLLNLTAAAPQVVASVVQAQAEAERLKTRIIADTAGRVKAEEFQGFDFDRAVIILKPVAPAPAPEIVRA
jgi:hypothetical protein